MKITVGKKFYTVHTSETSGLCIPTRKDFDIDESIKHDEDQIKALCGMIKGRRETIAAKKMVQEYIENNDLFSVESEK